MNFKNSKQFVQTLEEFDQTQQKLDGFPNRISLKERFKSLANEISDMKAYNWWRKVPILLLVIIVTVIIAWQLLVFDYAPLSQGFAFIAVCLLLFGYKLIENKPLQEAYIRRKKFAQQLRDKVTLAINHYTELKQQNDTKRNDAIHCQNPLVYYPEKDFTDFMSPEQIQQYWEKKTLPSIMAECDKTDQYIQSSLVRVEQEREFLKAIINY